MIGISAMGKKAPKKMSHITLYSVTVNMITDRGIHASMGIGRKSSKRGKVNHLKVFFHPIITPSGTPMIAPRRNPRTTLDTVNAKFVKYLPVGR